MKKNLCIVLLSISLVLSLIALNHVTRRWDITVKYVRELEKQYPDYVDTVSGGDIYNEYYNY